MEIRESILKLREDNHKLKEKIAKLEKRLAAERAALFADFKLIPLQGCLRHKNTGEIACPKCQKEGILSYVSVSKKFLSEDMNECDFQCHACGNSFTINKRV